jgi:diacylglycerol kinase family enzyme
LEANVDTILKGYETKLDVGEVTAKSDDGLVLRRDLFFDSLGFGLSASILAQRNRDLEKTRSVPVLKHMYRDHVVYVRAALQELAVSLVSRDRFTAEVTVDGTVHELSNLTDLLIKNTLIFAGDWIVDADSKHDDGRVEIAPFRGVADWTGRVIVNHRKFPIKKDAMERIGLSPSPPLRGSSIHVQLLRPHKEEAVPCELDGEEFIAANYFEIKVHPRLLNLIVPEHPHWI